MFKISVIIPCYNAEQWIGRAITSVLNQTVKPVEIIVIDDGSTDGTAQVVQKYGAKVRYFNQQNSGPAIARNRGIDKAKCEWIAFLDADDEWMTHKIESQMRVLEKNPDLKWCSCAHEDVKNGNATPHPLPESLKVKAIYPGGLSFFSAWLEGMTFGTPSFVIHRSVFDEIGGFDPEMLTGEDTDMWDRIALKNPRIAYCSDVLWRCYQDNPNSASRLGRGYRDLQLQSLCKNMRQADSFGYEIVREFRPYARAKAVDYLIQAAGKTCLINPNTIEDANTLFPLSLRERTLLQILTLLPKPIALKLVGRLTL